MSKSGGDHHSDHPIEPNASDPAVVLGPEIMALIEQEFESPSDDDGVATLSDEQLLAFAEKMLDFGPSSTIRYETSLQFKIKLEE